MNGAAGRRLPAEFTGTGLLVAVVVGSVIAATRLTTGGALRLLVNSVVTALGLAVLIVVFIQAGGAHFNPVVTAADWLLGRRTPRAGTARRRRRATACQDPCRRWPNNVAGIMLVTGRPPRRPAAISGSHDRCPQIPLICLTEAGTQSAGVSHRRSRGSPGSDELTGVASAA